MQSRTILITGGAGFIGSHATDFFRAQGHTVKILDSFEPQVHHDVRPAYLSSNVECIVGNVCDPDVVMTALQGVDTVIHCAAMTSAGQSQYDIRRYTNTNVTGTATLIDCLVKKDITLDAFLLPSSMMVYGEGAYMCEEHGCVHPRTRPVEQLQSQNWEMHCPHCKKTVQPISICERLSTQPETLYGLSKRMQEEIVLNAVETFGLPATVLRLFNVFGTRQSLKNPYTGVVAHFLAKLNLGKAPIIHEDGQMTRDFVSVHDVISAMDSALRHPHTGEIFNIGSGTPWTIRDLAHLLIERTGAHVTPEFSGISFKNNILHSRASTSKAKELLLWEPHHTLYDGIDDVISWAKHEDVTDKGEQYQAELKKASLLIQST